MLRLNRLNSAGHFAALLTATTNSKRFLRLYPPISSLAFVNSSRCCVRDPPSPTAANGVDDFVHVGEGDKISGETHETLPENGGENEANGSNDNNNFYRRKVLPPELSKSVVTLTCDSAAEGGVCDVYLVGTVHVSRESCQEVQAVIEFLKPEVVFLELCSRRRAILSAQNWKVPAMGEMMEMWKKNHNLFGILHKWFLAKVASKLEVFPGAEFRVAFEEARKYGSKVILGDRPVQITLRRTWAKMPLWHMTKLISSFLFVAVLPTPVLTRMLKGMYGVDMLSLIQEMSKQCPTLVETILHERDQYMSAMLLRIAREHNSVVAVVGKGHLPGIQKNWKQPVDMKQLLTMPPQRNTIPVGKVLTSIGVTVAGVAILSGLYLSIKK